MQCLTTIILQIRKHQHLGYIGLRPLTTECIGQSEGYNIILKKVQIMSSEISVQQQVDRFMQGAGGALTDDTVARLGFMINELLIIADRITGARNIMKLLEMSESKDLQKFLMCGNAVESQKNAPKSSGIGGMLKVMGDPNVQNSLRLLGSINKELNK